MNPILLVFGAAALYILSRPKSVEIRFRTPWDKKRRNARRRRDDTASDEGEE
jgi:hypothetical protein